MRYTITLAAFAAAAFAQTTVLPISQISDGQIQAPPATSAPAAGSSAASYPVVVPSVTESKFNVIQLLLTRILICSQASSLLLSPRQSLSLSLAHLAPPTLPSP